MSAENWRLIQTGLTSAFLSPAFFLLAWQWSWLRHSRADRAFSNVIALIIAFSIGAIDLFFRSWRFALFQRVEVVILFSYFVYVHDVPTARSTLRNAICKLLFFIAVFCAAVLLVPLRNNGPARVCAAALSLLVLVPMPISLRPTGRGDLSRYGPVFVVVSLVAGGFLAASNPYRAYDDDDNVPLRAYYIVHTIEMIVFLCLAGGSALFALSRSRLGPRAKAVEIDIKQFALTDGSMDEAEAAQELRPLNLANAQTERSDIESRTESL